MIWLLLFIPLLAVIDRAAGWKGVFDYIAPPVIAFVGWWIGARSTVSFEALGPSFYFPWQAVALAMAEFIYRNPGWDTFGGSLDPTKSQLAGTFYRHLLALIYLMALWPVWFAAIPLLLLYALAATALARWIKTARNNGKQVNWISELVRGALRGAVIAASLAAGVLIA